jgi:DNA-binding SARP family transcriptional activator
MTALSGSIECPAGDVLDFRILGPFEVVDHQPLALGGRKQKAVLAALLLHRGEVVTSDRLIEALWGERAPATASKTVQVYVSNLRKALGDGHLVTQGGGYVLAIEPDQVDADRFAKLAANGRDALERGEAQQARAMLQGALALWRGPALADFSYDSFAEPEIARLEEARLAALEDRLEAELDLGHHAALVPELEALVHEHPLRERLYQLLIVALYRSGRQVDALDRYQRARTKLIDEFGIEPGPQLQEIQRAVLSQDASLDLPAPPPRRRLPAPRRRSAWGLAAAAFALIALVVILATNGGGGHSPAHAAVGRVKIVSPASGGLYAKGEHVATSFSCSPARHGPAVRSCRDSNGASAVRQGGGALDTSRLGAKRYTVVMTLTSGATKTAAITYAVVPLRVVIASGRAVASHSRTAVSLACIGGNQGGVCHGALSITRRGATLARTGYSLRAGGMRTVVLPLTHRGTIVLRHARGHRVRALVTATLQFARPAERTVTFRHR